MNTKTVTAASEESPSVAYTRREEGTLRGEVLTSREALASFLPKWRSFLAGRVTGRILFNDPDYVAARLELEPGCRPLVILVWRQDELQAVVPFYVSSGQFALRLSVKKLAAWPARIARLFGDDIHLATGASATECIATALASLLHHRAAFDLIAFDPLATDSVLWNIVTGSIPGCPEWRAFLADPQLEVRHQIVFPGSHEAYLASLGARTRQNLRRMARKLCHERQGRLVRITRPEEVPSFLEAVDRVYRETWQAKTFGYWPRNRPDQLAFFEEMARRGWLRSYLLYDGEQPLAFDIAFQYGDVFHAYEIGFDQRAAEHSPGTVLMHLFIEDLFRERTPRLLDFGTGDAAYKRSFSNLSRDTAALWLIPPGRWRWIARMQRGVFALERGCRRILVTLRMDRVVRRLLKRQR